MSKPPRERARLTGLGMKHGVTGAALEALIRDLTVLISQNLSIGVRNHDTAKQ